MSTYITADTIRTLREQQGLTQRALAEAVGVTDKAFPNGGLRGNKHQGALRNKTHHSRR